MNYIKIFRELEYSEAEEIINSYLREIQGKDHRVMHSRAFAELNDITFVFVINDEPHPHKKKNK